MKVPNPTGAVSSNLYLQCTTLLDPRVSPIPKDTVIFHILDTFQNPQLNRIMLQVTRDVAENTDNPSGTAELVGKVRDVAETYLLTVRAAGDAIGKRVSSRVDTSPGIHPKLRLF